MDEANRVWVHGLKEKGDVTADDVIQLRREVFGDGVVSRDEAEMVFDLNEAIENPILSWSDFFVDVMSGYFLRQSNPPGYVNDEAAGYLKERISQDGRVQSASELELLVTVIDRAHAAPNGLIDFALSTLRESVLTGEGPTRRNADLKPGVIGEAEVDLIERIIFGTGGSGNIAVSKTEAEFLFDLNDATSEADNHPNWSRLFVKGVSNYLMAALSYSAPSQEEALRREAWLEERSSVGGFIGRMVGSISQGPAGLFKSMFLDREMEAAREQHLSDQQATIRQNEKITGTEAEWVITRIEKDGIIHGNERALLQFIVENSPEVDPRLEPLINKVA